MRPDGEPRAGDRLLQTSQPRSLRRRRPRLGRARNRAVAPQRRAARLETILRRRSLDPCALHDRRHGRQQFLRLEVDPLRPDGRQRHGHRGHPRRRLAPSLRRNPRRLGRHSPTSSSACMRSARPRPTRSRRGSPSSCAASAATTSTPSRPPPAPPAATTSPACSSAPRARWPSPPRWSWSCIR